MSSHTATTNLITRLLSSFARFTLTNNIWLLGITPEQARGGGPAVHQSAHGVRDAATFIWVKVTETPPGQLAATQRSQADVGALL